MEEAQIEGVSASHAATRIGPSSALSTEVDLWQFIKLAYFGEFHKAIRQRMRYLCV
jgi:hypothetical protein